MTRDTGVDDGAAQADDEEEAEPFEGAPIEGRTALTAEDFKAIWSKLPQNRSAMKTFGLMALGIPSFAVVHWLLSDGDRPSPMSWVYVVAPVIVALALARGVWKGRLAWADNAVKDMRSLEGVGLRFDAAGINDRGNSLDLRGVVLAMAPPRPPRLASEGHFSDAADSGLERE